MKTRIAILIALLCMGVAWAAQPKAKGAEKYDLRYHFTPGQVRYYVVRADTTTTSGGQSTEKVTPEKISMAVWVSVEVLKVDTYGDATLKVTAQEFTVNTMGITKTYTAEDLNHANRTVTVSPHGIWHFSTEIKDAPQGVERMAAEIAIQLQTSNFLFPTPPFPLKVGGTWVVQGKEPWSNGFENSIGDPQPTKKSTYKFFGIKMLHGKPVYHIHVTTAIAGAMPKKGIANIPYPTGKAVGIYIDDYWLSCDGSGILAAERSSSATATPKPGSSLNLFGYSPIILKGFMHLEATDTPPPSASKAPSVEPPK
ncbi:MAG: hypothetical protein WCO51_00955 [bacterium]